MKKKWTELGSTEAGANWSLGDDKEEALGDDEEEVLSNEVNTKMMEVINQCVAEEKAKNGNEGSRETGMDSGSSDNDSEGGPKGDMEKKGDAKEEQDNKEEVEDEDNKGEESDNRKIKWTERMTQKRMRKVMSVAVRIAKVQTTKRNKPRIVMML